MRPARPTPSNLSPAERRVLDAFYCGRLPAGRLSGALAVARRSPEPAPAAARSAQATIAPARLRVAA